MNPLTSALLKFTGKPILKNLWALIPLPFFIVALAGAAHVETTMGFCFMITGAYGACLNSIMVYRCWLLKMIMNECN